MREISRLFLEEVFHHQAVGRYVDFGLMPPIRITVGLRGPPRKCSLAPAMKHPHKAEGIAATYWRKRRAGLFPIISSFPSGASVPAGREG